jgi:uncharacterized protein (TIGR02099 family)
MPKWLSHSPRYYYYTFAIVIIVAAICLQSLRLLAPKVDQLRPSIEKFISAEINAEVRLGHITASWYGLRPQVLVSDIEVVAGDVPRVRIAKADFTLDILSSVLHFQWVWRKVVFDHIDVDLQQDKQGAWSIGGLAIESQNRSSWRYRSPEELFNTVSQIDINHANIQLIFANKKTIRTQIPAIKIENLDDFHRLTASAVIEDKDVFALVLERQAGVGVNHDVTGFVQLSQFPLESVIEGFALDQPLSLSGDSPNQSSINSTLWFDFNADKTFDVVGSIALSGLPQSPEAKKQGLNFPVNSDVRGHFDSLKGWSLGLRNLTLDQSHIIEQVLLRQDAGNVQAIMDRVVIEQWMPLLEKHFVSEEEAKKALGTMNPQGEISHITFDINPQHWLSTTLSANVRNVSVQPFESIPGISHVNGYLETTLSKGFINLATEQLHFSPRKVYDHPLVFDRIDGQVAWNIEPEENRIFVNSNQLQTESTFGRANGYFALDLPWERDSRPSDFILHLGVENSSVEHYSYLMPNRVPEDLENWLSKSLLAGRIDNAGFIYRGGFSGDENTRSIQLFLDVDEVDLADTDGWPGVTAASGRVLVDNQYAYVTTHKANIVGEPVDRLAVTWEGDERKELNVNVDSRFSAKLGLHYLNETRLNEKVGDTFSSWSTEGDIHVSVDVDVPLLESAEDKGISPKQSVKVTFLDTVITLNQQQLALQSITGDLLYSEKQGLSSNNLSVSLFEHPLGVELSQDFAAEDNNEYISIAGKSVADITSLSNWLDMPEILSLDGDLPYSVDLQIPLGKVKPYLAKISLNSDLYNVSSDLPKPLSKEKTEKRDLRFTGFIHEERIEYSLILDDVMQMGLQFSDKRHSGFLALGKDADVPENYTEESFLIDAVLDDVVLEDWLSVLLARERSDISEGDTDKVGMALNYSIYTKNLQLKERVFQNVLVVGERKAHEWNADIENALLKGTAKWDDRFTRPVELTLDYIRIPKPEEELSPVFVDPLADVDLSVIKPIQVKINDLNYHGADLGEWRFIVDPVDDGVKVDQLYGRFGDMLLSGKEDDTGAAIYWKKQLPIVGSKSSSLTTFDGQLAGGNVGQLFKSLGFSPLIESQSTDIDLSLSWEGSPAFFAVERMKGNLHLDLKNGLFIREEGQRSTGILRLFGLFNFNTWARRLKLDFSDLYKKGVVFDSVGSRLVFDKGLIYFQEPLLLKAPSSEFTMAGSIDYPNESIDAVLVTTLPVSGNLTFLAAFAAGLPAAAGVYIVSKVFKPQVDKVSSLTYAVKGSWSDPEVKFLNLFDNNTQVRPSSPEVVPEPSFDGE